MPRLPTRVANTKHWTNLDNDESLPRYLLGRATQGRSGGMGCHGARGSSRRSDEGSEESTWCVWPMHVNFELQLQEG